MSKVKSTSKKVKVILLIFLIIICGAAIALFVLTKKEKDKTGEFQESAAESEQALPKSTEPALPANQSGIVIPEIVNSYQGEVLEKGENFLRLKISALDNYIETDQEIEAHFDERTAITQIVIFPSAGANQKPRVEMRNISAAEIEIGETVTVITRENIKGRTSFRAESIRAVEQKL